MKRTLRDFSFSLSKQKIVAAEENEKEVVSGEDDGWEAKDVSFGASVSVPPSFILRAWPSIVLSYS